MINRLLDENTPTNDALLANIGTNIEMSIDTYCDLGIFINQTSSVAGTVKDDSFHDLREPPPSYETYHVPVPKINNKNDDEHNCSYFQTTNQYSDAITNKVLTAYFDTFNNNLQQACSSPG